MRSPQAHVRLDINPAKEPRDFRDKRYGPGPTRAVDATAFLAATPPADIVTMIKKRIVWYIGADDGQTWCQAWAPDIDPRTWDPRTALTGAFLDKSLTLRPDDQTSVQVSLDPTSVLFWVYAHRYGPLLQALMARVDLNPDAAPTTARDVEKAWRADPDAHFLLWADTQPHLSPRQRWEAHQITQMRKRLRRDAANLFRTALLAAYITHLTPVPPGALARYVYGDGPRHDHMNAARALAYATAGISPSEACRLEDGPDADRPTASTLATLAALRYHP